MFSTGGRGVGTTGVVVSSVRAVTTGAGVVSSARPWVRLPSPPSSSLRGRRVMYTGGGGGGSGTETVEPLPRVRVRSLPPPG